MPRVRLDFGKARITAIAVGMAAGLALIGCGSSDSEEGGGGATKKITRTPSVARPDMVAAVSSSKLPGAVALRFAIPQRPVVGQRVEIQLSLTPSVPLERLVAHFQAPEGLELVSGAETRLVGRPTLGDEISHTLTVIPRSDGIFNITAVVLTDSATESLARTFSIPVIAGAGVPEFLPPISPSPSPP
jgi:hypothetical protein